MLKSHPWCLGCRLKLQAAASACYMVLAAWRYGPQRVQVCRLSSLVAPGAQVPLGHVEIWVSGHVKREPAFVARLSTAPWLDETV